MGILRALVDRPVARRGLSIENPGVPLTDPAWAEAMGYGSEGDAGVRVTHAKSLRIAPVWQAIHLISGDVAKLPCNVYRREGEYRQVDTNHPAQKLIRRRANDRQNAFDFWRQVMVQRLLWNQAFIWIDRRNPASDRPTALYQLLSDRSELVDIDGEPYVISEVNNELRAFPYADVLHLKGISLDGVNGFDLIDAARAHFSKMLAAIQFSSRFFKNGGRMGGILELPIAMAKKARDRVEEGFRKTYDSDDAAFRTVILRDGAKFHAAQFNPRDAQLIEVDQNDARKVANYFNLPGHKLGVVGTTSYASVEAENRSYYDGCLSHYLMEIAAEAAIKLLSAREQETDSHFVEHTVAALLWADTQTVASIISEGIQNSWMSPNEGRRLLNWGPRPDGQGDAYLQQLNMGTVQRGGSVSDPSESDQARAKIDAALAQLRADTLQRLANRLGIHARKAAKRRAAFSAWLTSELESEHLEAARSMLAPLSALEAACGKQSVTASEYLRGFRTAIGLAYEQAGPTDAELVSAVDVAIETWQANLLGDK